MSDNHSQNLLGNCNFCGNECTGAFRHVLAASVEHAAVLKLVFAEHPHLSVKDSQRGSYPTCDKCRRKLLTMHNVPESCFQIRPYAEMVDVKLEEVEIDFSPQDSDSSMDADRLDEIKALMEPEAEMHIKGENGEMYVISCVNGRIAELSKDLDGDGAVSQNTFKRSRAGCAANTKRERRPRNRNVKHRCNICGKGFVDKCLMATHIRWHTGEKPFKCEDCGKGFCEKSKLKIHRRIHTGERPYTCPYCLKTFTQLVTLKTHIRIHTREMPYACQYCPKRFTQSYNLTIHERLKHNQIKVYRGREVGVIQEFECNICGKKYRSPKSFRLHEKLHHMGQLFNCNACNKQYTYVHKCKANSKDKNGTVYTCTVCGQEFKHQQSVVYHMAFKHEKLGQANFATTKLNESVLSDGSRKIEPEEADELITAD